MIGDVAKSFGKDFITSYLVPAAILVGANLALTLAGVLPAMPAAYTRALDLSVGGILAGEVVLAALALYQFQTAIIRIYEGYSESFFTWSAVGGLVGSQGAWALGLWTAGTVILVAALFVAVIAIVQHHRKPYHQSERRRLTAEVETLEGLPRARREFALHRAYPSDDELVLPTKLGNIVRAFEHHPVRLYNVDAIAGWPRLMTVLPAHMRDLIGNAQSDCNTLLNTSFVFFVIALGCFITAAIKFSAVSMFAALGSLALGWILYLLACPPAQQWGEYVRAAFDLYRLDLLKQTGIEIKVKSFTLEEEQNYWALIQEPMLYLKDPGEELRLQPRATEKEQQDAKEREEKEDDANA
jgi:hypothetical protein